MHALDAPQRVVHHASTMRGDMRASIVRRRPFPRPLGEHEQSAHHPDERDDHQRRAAQRRNRRRSEYDGCGVECPTRDRGCVWQGQRTSGSSHRSRRHDNFMPAVNQIQYRTDALLRRNISVSTAATIAQTVDSQM